MRHGGIRLAGAALLILAALALLIGAAGFTMESEGGLGHGLYAQAADAQARLDAARAALDDLIEYPERLEGRAATAVESAQAALDAAQAVDEAARAGSFGEDELAALGELLYAPDGAQGFDLDAAREAYLAVYGAPAREAADEAAQAVKKIRDTSADAAASAEALNEAVRALGEPGFEEPPARSDFEGADGALTARAQALLDGARAAQADAAALGEAIPGWAEAARAAIAAHPLTLWQRCAFLARDRAADIAAVGGVLLLIALAMLLLPGWVSGRWKLRVFRHGFLLAVIVGLLAMALRYAPGDTWALMRQGVIDTLYMTLPATALAYLLGLPLGILLVITAPGHIRPSASFNAALGAVINFLRSIPFVILLVMLFDVTRFVMGTAIGTRSIIFPLFVSAFPYVARMVEGSLNEVDRGVIEAAESMGSTAWQIIRKVLLPEALPSLISGAAICTTTILAYTAMAGAAGGDGLGKIAITYGLNYRNYEIMYIASLLLVALVQIIQIAGDILTRGFDHRRR